MEATAKMAEIHESLRFNMNENSFFNLKKMRDSSEASGATLSLRWKLAFLSHYIRVIIISLNSSLPAALHIRRTQRCES